MDGPFSGCSRRGRPPQRADRRRHMPVYVLPSTAVVTRIGYGPRERVTVHGLAGEPFEIRAGPAGRVRHGAGNPANEKGVAVVDGNSPRAVRGVRFVDTPGLGSAFAHNTRVSRLDASRRARSRRRQRQPPPFRRRPCRFSTTSSHTLRRSLPLTKADLVSGEEPRR